MDNIILTAKRIINEKGLFGASDSLKEAFGPKNVESLGFYPGFLVRVNGKKIAILSAKYADDPDTLSDDGSIAIGYF